MHTEILIYHGFDELDAIGPFEVLGAAGFEVALVTADDDAPVVTAHGARSSLTGSSATPWTC